LFFRTDLPAFEHILVQTNHSSFKLAQLRGDPGTPNLVAIGMPNVRALERVLRKLQAHGIPHYPWYEPDHDFGLTAIATAPLDADSPERELLQCYRVYRAPVVTTASTAAPKADGASSNLAGRANAGASPDIDDYGSIRAPAPLSERL
jgi:hypothetical protein